MELLNVKEAANWAEKYLKNTYNADVTVTESNISYLIQYGRLGYIRNDGLIEKKNLKNYYDEFYSNKIKVLSNELGPDVNITLAFDNLKEKERTKHVHRIHPYKGKFIPQLVEYFLDDHVDNFKTEIFFEENDVVLDPFLGSGTTLVQAKELGLHSVGVDISKFNCMISDAKLADYDIDELERAFNNVFNELNKLDEDTGVIKFDKRLRDAMSKFNKENFPSPDYKIKVFNKEIDEKSYSESKTKEFYNIYVEMAKEEGQPIGWEYNDDAFLEKWFHPSVNKEFNKINEIIKNETDKNIETLLKVVLSRSIRSCRATTHSDLATLKSPQMGPYYCHKHFKICTPIQTMIPKFRNYMKDTLKRIKEYSNLKTNSYHAVLHGDSTSIDIFKEVKKQNEKFYNILAENKVQGIFTSPPYLGHIDYHEQHAYSYELFDIERHDSKEIGKLSDGKTKKAQEDYIAKISDVLINSKNFLADNPDIFIVANDQMNLYPEIAKRSGMKIVQEYKRPVLNRTERNKKLYQEKIFHLKNVKDVK